MRQGQDYTIGQLPRLISQRFDRFNEALLSQEELSPEDRESLYQPFRPRELSEADRNLVRQFLQQWNHPVGFWLREESSASLLEQIRQIRNLAAHPSSVHEWHFRQLCGMVTEENGLLRQVYWENSAQQHSELTGASSHLEISEIRRPSNSGRLR